MTSSAGHSIVVEMNIYELFHWAKRILGLEQIGCRPTLVVAICGNFYSWSLTSCCGRWASPAMTSLSWMFGRNAPVSALKKTSRHRRRAIVDLTLPECLNRAVSRQSTPRQRTLPLSSLLIFESF